MPVSVNASIFTRELIQTLSLSRESFSAVDMTTSSQEPELHKAAAVRPHGLLAKLFHWGFAVLFVYAATNQIDSVDQLQDLALLRFEMAFAFSFLLLLAARFIYMQSTRPTALPEDAPEPLEYFARRGHLLIYVCLALMPLSGLLIAGLLLEGSQSGFLLELAVELHELTVSASFVVIALHISAALCHRQLRDGIWNSMVPFWKE